MGTGMIGREGGRKGRREGWREGDDNGVFIIRWKGRRRGQARELNWSDLERWRE